MSSVVLPTKHGQPSTSSPRTTENNRRQFSSFFQSFSSSPRSKQPSSKLAGSHPTIMDRPQSGREEDENAEERDEGCFVDAASSFGRDLQDQSQDGRCFLTELPDEL